MLMSAYQAGVVHVIAYEPIEVNVFTKYLFSG